MTPWIRSKDKWYNLQGNIHNTNKTHTHTTGISEEKGQSDRRNFLKDDGWNFSKSVERHQLTDIRWANSNQAENREIYT